jgi:hypothetical protein
MKRQPVAGVDFDADKGMCQDDYEWFTSTGQYAGAGWAEWQEKLEQSAKLSKVAAAHRQARRIMRRIRRRAR